MKSSNFILSLAFILACSFAFSQRGKNNDFTVTSLGTVVNAYTNLTTNATFGSTSIIVASNVLTNTVLTTPLAAGDLIMIVQMQGAFLNIDTYDAISFGGGTKPYNIPPGFDANQIGEEFGIVNYYNNSGKYSVHEVQSVSGSNIINIACSLPSDFSVAGHTQIVRIPRYNNLMLGNNSSIIPLPWNGTTGGVVAVEVLGNLVMNANSLIDATGLGFRGGVVAGQSFAPSGLLHPFGPGNGSSHLGHTNIGEGAEKGEGIAGSAANEYLSNFYSRYGRGAMANGGGGGGIQNAGGGGGANVGAGVRTGKGIPTPGYTAIWNLEKAGFGSSVSPGGGRGGYSLAQSNANPAVNGPNKAPWNGDFRKENGGYGGEALAFDPTRMFMGGGGGAGGQDSGQGGNGGAGGGICYVDVYGTVSGSGGIRSNGAVGKNSNPNNDAATLFTQIRGNDGAGGGGAGGYVYVRNMNPLPASISLIAVGGAGGDQDFRKFSGSPIEIGGPGAGGAGGGIAFTSGSPSTSIVGGASGHALFNGSTSSWATAFPPNGATNGGTGLINTTTFYNLIPANDTICSGESATVSVAVLGTQPPSSTISWYTGPYINSPIVATGNTFTPGTPPAVTTTYYVGICPGSFRVPVKIVVGQNPTITGTAVITNATCNTAGSITGLSGTGGLAPLIYSWNGTVGTQNLTAPSGSYTLTVTDQNGCSAQSGPHTIVGVGGPTITGTPVITNATCIANGSISGLTASGGTGTLTFTWNADSSPTENLPTAVAGSYTLTVTDGSGCTATSGPHIIGTTPGPTVSGTATITDATCIAAGSITGLSATGGVGPFVYSWNGTNGTANLTGATAGSYTLTITDSGTGCTVTSGPHTIGTTPNPTISGTPVVANSTCIAGGSVTGLTGTGGSGTYTYSWNGVNGTANLTGATAGSYTLVITDGNGCTANSGPHIIGTAPNPTVSGTAVITNATCSTTGSITGLSGAGGVGPYIYGWNGNLGTANLTGATAGSYTLTILDSGTGCTVTSGPHVIASVGGPVINVTNLTIINETCNNSNGSIAGLTVSGGTPGYTFTWNGNTTASALLIGVAAGNYTLVVTDLAGCTVSSGPHTITNTPAPTINDASVVVTDESCTGVKGSITGITTTGTNLVYLWTNSGGSQVDATNLNQGAYSLTVTDPVTGCSVTSGPYLVGSISGPTVSSTNVVVTDEICDGTLGSITGITATGTGTLFYSWTNTSSTIIDATGLYSGTYELTVTDGATGCFAVAGPFIVNYIAGPTAQFSYSPTEPFTDQLVNFTDQSTGTIVNWLWNIDTLSSSNQNQTYTFTNDGVYTATLTVIDQNGCTNQMTVNITVVGDLVIPNVITPNADGANDFFILTGLKPNTRVLIFNRWGDEVFNSSNYMNEWNGRDKSGGFCTDGVYTYLVTLPNGSQKHGFVHVVRND